MSAQSLSSSELTHAAPMLRLADVCLDERLDNIALSVAKGQWWTLLGANGAGKSTLLSVCAGLEPYEGSVSLFDSPTCEIKDMDLGTLASRRCLLTQHYQTEFSISVAEIFSFFTPLSQVPKLIEDYLDIHTFYHKRYDQLSGGEQQRVHLARALMQVWPAIESGGALILLDEPTQQMDVRHQVSALNLCQCLIELGNTIVMSHHDINHAQEYSSHVCMLKNASVMMSGPSAEVMKLAHLQALYEHNFYEVPRVLEGDEHGKTRMHFFASTRLK